MNIARIQALVAPDMERVDKVIQTNLASDVVLINQLSHYIISAGGKRLRPQLVMLASRACGYDGEAAPTLAAVVEFIHTATLLHDDVVDASALRRGRETANAVWGNEAAVLVGDFLYSRAFEMMVSVGSMEVMEVLSVATNRIAQGEVMQLMNVNDPDVTQEAYLEVIRAKTARLFQAATHLGAILAGSEAPVRQGVCDYGIHLGTAFQIVDDVLDYTQSAEEMGKNLGDDLAEGKPTLPLILTMQRGTQAQAALVRRAIENGGLDELDEVLAAVRGCGALEASQQVAEAEAQRAVDALSVLPASEYREALEGLARLSVARTK
ncbi:octaprenyl diphosphate synthase [Granulosicoccaceae sp. 1_MG-2023]|nr:octaprenyl diphosphate synthase [Granulosicoccaceae sp. 1_MG-2023]